ncbi:hypothetical protein D3Y59_07515 [Hymenobacter oligotrophus]|uniref:Uncharacterized protein n=1 Tax=Hymenobacter oligotrophus TaxID=2319843 RepID=A0A3B7QZ76_9BACT|nr:hypothetical protein [Hymenobacter oligotrophus]AYA36915.1 hypothetical protein D3Y59_07515 [Hymenobacter oligotrophus]
MPQVATPKTETPQPLSNRVGPAPAAKPVPASPTAQPVAPAPRMRYWEQIDPASHSLYPVD